MVLLVCYDANVLNEVKKDMQIIKVKLQHWTSRQEHVVIHVCMLGMLLCRLRIVMCIRVIYITFMYMSFDVMVTFMIDAS